MAIEQTCAALYNGIVACQYAVLKSRYLKGHRETPISLISSDVHCQGKGLRKLAEELYDWFLSEYELGDCGEAELDEAEKRLTVRSRLNAAAGRQNVVLEFKLPAYRAERASMLTERFQRFTMP